MIILPLGTAFNQHLKAERPLQAGTQIYLYTSMYNCICNFDYLGTFSFFFRNLRVSTRKVGQDINKLIFTK